MDKPHTAASSTDDLSTTHHLSLSAFHSKDSALGSSDDNLNRVQTHKSIIIDDDDDDDHQHQQISSSPLKVQHDKSKYQIYIYLIVFYFLNYTIWLNISRSSTLPFRMMMMQYV
jgi:hypothetical protein